VDSFFSTVKTTGDVPMPRSGHAAVAYGKYMFLFGGIDFKEEAVFNDLYILNTGKTTPTTLDIIDLLTHLSHVATHFSIFHFRSFHTSQTLSNGDTSANPEWR